MMTEGGDLAFLDIWPEETKCALNASRLLFAAEAVEPWAGSLGKNEAEWCDND